jgi:hypothetical protein
MSYEDPQDRSRVSSSVILLQRKRFSLIWDWKCKGKENWKESCWIR